MTEQIGYKELIKYIFENKDMEELTKEKYFENSSSITKIGYKKIKWYLDNNKKISDFNLFLGILSSLAYGNPEELKDTITKILIINNRELILSNIDSLEQIVSGTLKLEELDSIQYIINIRMSFKLLNFVYNNWIEYRLHKKYFYGINYLLVYFSKYCYDDFETWFLSTKSKNLKVIFTSQILSSSNFYQNEEVYLTSKIDFLRAIAKTTIYTWKKKFFDNQKEITDLVQNYENIYFVMLYIQKNYYKLNKENIDNFTQEIEKLEKYFRFLSIKNLNEFIQYIDFEILYEIINKINNTKLKEKLLFQLQNEIKQQFESFFKKSYFLDDEINKINLYGKIILNLQQNKEIENIKSDFEKIYNEINEPYYFYRFNDKWKLLLKKLVYYLIIIYIFYFDDYENNNLIINYKEKIYNTLKEFNFYNINEIKSLLKQINANKT